MTIDCMRLGQIEKNRRPVRSRAARKGVGSGWDGAARAPATVRRSPYSISAPIGEQGVEGVTARRPDLKQRNLAGRREVQSRDARRDTSNGLKALRRYGAGGTLRGEYGRSPPRRPRCRKERLGEAQDLRVRSKFCPARRIAVTALGVSPASSADGTWRSRGVAGWRVRGAGEAGVTVPIGVLA